MSPRTWIAVALGVAAAGAPALADGPPVLLATWGSLGNEPGQFNSPRGVAIGPDGSVIVMDSGNARIQRFDTEGNLLQIVYTSQFSIGIGVGIAVGPTGTIYITDTQHDKVRMFDAEGFAVKEWGNLRNPWGITLDREGHLYVVDSGNDRIVKYDDRGVYLSEWGSFGLGDGQFVSPIGIAIDSNDRVYVIDYESRVQIFDRDGRFLAVWGSKGPDVGQLRAPMLHTVDRSGNLYVTDWSRVQKFTSDGAFLAAWGRFGGGPGEFRSAWGIAVDSAGDIYVTDSGNHNVQKYGTSLAVESESWSAIKHMYR